MRALSPRPPATRPLCECGFRRVVLERLAELEEAYVVQHDVHRRYVTALNRVELETATKIHDTERTESNAAVFRAIAMLKDAILKTPRET